MISQIGQIFQSKKDELHNPTPQATVNSISFFKLFKYATDMDLIYIVIAICFSILTGIVMQTNSLIFASLFQSMVHYGHHVTVEHQQSQELYTAIRSFAVKASLVGVAIIVMSYCSSTLINIAAYNQIFKIRQLYLKAILYQDFEFFDSTSTEFISKMHEDVVKIQEGISEKLISFVYLQSSFLTAIVMALMVGWELALECLITYPMIVFLIIGITTMKFVQRNHDELAKSLNKASSHVEEVFSSITTVFAFSGQQKEVDRYNKYLITARKHVLRHAIGSGLTTGVVVFCCHLMFAFAIKFAYNLLVSKPEKYSVEKCTVVILEVLSGSSSLNSALGLLETFTTARTVGGDIFHFISRVPKISKLVNRNVIPKDVKGVIEMIDVYFHFPSRPDIEVVQGVSLKVKEGQTVALVGDSGCGKSTIGQLICRFYDVDQGQVTIDGWDVREISVDWLRSHVTLVFPDTTLFNTDVRHNIGYGREHSTLQEVQDAARKAYAHPFIINLPQGYQTVLGERGMKLSGGQKQRIAIARALIRKPVVLILDEALCALDPAAQYKIQQALANLKSHTTILVSSIISTIKYADYIYVIDRGTVAESGTHKSLMRMKGNYYHMSLKQLHSTDDVERDDEYQEYETDFNFDLEETKYGETLASTNLDTIPKATFSDVVKLSLPEWMTVYVAHISCVINGMDDSIMALLFARVIGSLSDRDQEEITRKVDNSKTIMIGIGAIIGTTNFLQIFFYAYAAEKFVRRLRIQLFEHLLKQETAFFDEVDNSPDILSTVLSGEASNLKMAATEVGKLLQGAGTLLLALTISFTYEYRVALCALALVPLLVWTLYKQGRMSSDEFYGLEQISAKCFSVAAEAIYKVRTVIALGREKTLRLEYAKQYAIVNGFAKKRAHFRGLIFGLSLGVYNFVFAATMYYGGLLIINDAVCYASVIKSTQALLLGANSSAQLMMYAPNIESIVKSAGVVLALLNRKSKVEEPPINPLVFFRGTGEASFENVKFRYPTRPNVMVLNGFSLKIEKEQTVALVGANGSGRSTVINLLMRSYVPEEGKVCLDGIPLTELREADVRQSMGIVSQESVIFDRTIAENIAYGDNSKIIPLEEIIEVSKTVNLHNFIMSLPQAYDTNVGIKGSFLSNGQKRRLVIARALIRKPKLFLLDEASSTLGADSEKKVQDAIEQAQTGRSCLTVSDRLSRIRYADHIAVMNDGRVVEEGTHSELIKKKGLYYRLNMYEKRISTYIR